MSDHIARVAEVLDRHFTERDEDSGCARRCGYDGDDRADHIARALDAAGLLVTPEQHDAAVAAKALREAAGEINNPNATPDLESVARAVVYLRDRADRIEREAGESDADA